MAIQQEQKSRAIIIGAIISVIAAFLAMISLSFDFIFGVLVFQEQMGQNMVNIVAIRFVLIMLMIMFSVIFLVRNKPSIILSIGLILLEVGFIALPFFVYRNLGLVAGTGAIAESFGGFFASLLMLMGLIGSITIAISSFRK